MSLAMISKISKSISGINGEINLLRDEANNRIGRREAARSFINKHLNQMPKVISGVHLVSYQDDRGDWQVKEQSKNLSLWCVALQTTIETGHTSYALLGSILSQWSEDALGIEWPRETADRVAKLYVNEMQGFKILSDKLSKINYIDEETKEQRKSTVVKLHDEFAIMLEKEIDDMRGVSTMICRPLKNQPEDWVDSETGVGEEANLQLITNKTTRGTDIAQPVLDAVNRLQAVKFKIAPCIIEAAYDILDNQHEYESTVEELRMYREMLTLEDTTIYLAVTMDNRGRMYYRGGLLTPQGTDFCKAAFQLAEGKRLGEDGYKALFLQTANAFGRNKISINDRIKWVDENWDALMLISDHHDIAELYKSASVFQATVAVKELQKLNEWVQTNEAEDFISTLVCQQDGTCNGLQHMAAITKNRQTAIAVNCVASTHDDVPKDLYGIVADVAKDFVKDSIKPIMERHGRDMAKKPVMISGYGAGEETVISRTKTFLVKEKEDATHAKAIGKAYKKGIEQNAGAIKSLTGALKGRVTKAVANGATRFEWTTADGFVASTEYRDIECNRIRAGVFNALVRNMFPAPLDKVKTIGAMAPNFIHSIDATHLRLVINNCEHDLVTVHDSIGSHAATYFETAKVIREQFVAVHDFDALENLCESMGMRTPKFRGDYSASEALESAYIFS